MKITIHLREENGQVHNVEWRGDVPSDSHQSRDWMDHFLRGLPAKIHVMGINMDFPKQSVVGVTIETHTIIDGWRDDWNKPTEKPREPVSTCSKCGTPIYHAELFRGPVCPQCGHWC